MSIVPEGYYTMTASVIARWTLFYRDFLCLRNIIQLSLHANVKAGSIQNHGCYVNVVRKCLAMLLRGHKPGYLRHYITSEYRYMWEAWVSLTVHFVARWFANEFHSLLHYSLNSASVILRRHLISNTKNIVHCHQVHIINKFTKLVCTCPYDLEA